MTKEFEKFDTKKLTAVVHNGKICIDTKVLFNKPTDCPVQLPYPTTPDEARQFIEAVEWVTSEEARDISRHLNFEQYRKEYTK